MSEGEMPEETQLVFGRWRVVSGRRLLLCDRTPVPIGIRAFELLLALVEARRSILSTDRLLRRVWPGVVVEENSLPVQISALRRAGPGPCGGTPGARSHALPQSQR